MAIKQAVMHGTVAFAGLLREALASLKEKVHMPQNYVDILKFFSGAVGLPLPGGTRPGHLG
jgi:hypothetical protein